MNKLLLGKEIPVSRVALGCMRLAGMKEGGVSSLLETALSLGINCFDHADIYGGGESERIFAQSLPSHIKRESIVLQSKCGIRPGYYDFSKEHILASVEGSLKRLNTDYLDILLLHRPDALMEPEEVAEAFWQLKETKKVRAFGVSNHTPTQIQLLMEAVGDNLVANQLRLSIAYCPMIASGIHMNRMEEEAVDRDGGVLNFCQLKGITVQAWSPLLAGQVKECFIGHKDYPRLNQELETLAGEYGVDPEGISVAWLLRHPAKMQVIVGTTKEERLKKLCKGDEITLSREEWYRLYRSANKVLP